MLGPAQKMVSYGLGLMVNGHCDTPLRAKEFVDDARKSRASSSKILLNFELSSPVCQCSLITSKTSHLYCIRSAPFTCERAPPWQPSTAGFASLAPSSITTVHQRYRLHCFYASHHPPLDIWPNWLRGGTSSSPISSI
jgi:hypothetical protein